VPPVPLSAAARPPLAGGRGILRMLYALMLLFAQPPEETKREPTLIEWVMPLLLGVGVLYVFIVLLPRQRNERKQREAELAALKKNDEVVTAGGIIGVIASIKEGADEVTLKIDDNARIRVLKSSIVKVVPRDNKEGT
jgi:preprotein translocase subunit YajC